MLQAAGLYRIKLEEQIQMLEAEAAALREERNTLHGRLQEFDCDAV